MSKNIISIVKKLMFTANGEIYTNYSDVIGTHKDVHSDAYGIL